MNSICCKSPWCNCGCFDQYNNRPPCADKRIYPPKHDCCCCCCNCSEESSGTPVRRCCDLPVEPLGGSCGCSINC